MADSSSPEPDAGWEDLLTRLLVQNAHSQAEEVLAEEPPSDSLTAFMFGVVIGLAGMVLAIWSAVRGDDPAYTSAYVGVGVAVAVITSANELSRRRDRFNWHRSVVEATEANGKLWPQVLTTRDADLALQHADLMGRLTRLVRPYDFDQTEEYFHRLVRDARRG